MRGQDRGQMRTRMGEDWEVRERYGGRAGHGRLRAGGENMPKRFTCGVVALNDELLRCTAVNNRRRVMQMCDRS